MKKVTKEVVGAFLKREAKTVSNTKTARGLNYQYLSLYGNIIARLTDDGIVSITDAGWPTVTTKERLNAIPGVSISQKKGVWYLNGEKWDGSWTQIHAIS